MHREICRVLLLALLVPVASIAGCDKQPGADEAQRAEAKTPSNKQGAARPPSKENENCRVELIRGGEGSQDAPSWSAGDEPGTVHVRAQADQIRQFRDDEHGTFVSFERSLMAGMPFPTVPIWKVDCASPTQSSVYHKQKGTNFGTWVEHPERDLLYAAAKGGLVALELQTPKVTRVDELAKTTKLPTGAKCGIGEGRSFAPVDVPVFVNQKRNTVIVRRGGPCGYEAAWVFHYVELTLDDSGKGATARRLLHHPTEIAEGADGTLWLADGATDTLRVNNHFLADGLLKSTDGGDTWKPLDAPETKKGKSDRQPRNRPRLVVASQKKPGHLLVAGHPYTADGVGTRGGRLQYSDDGGTSWENVDPPEARNQRSDLGVWMVESVDGSLQNLRIWTLPHEDFEACEPFEFGASDTPTCPADKLSRWRTDDGGDNWKRIPENAEPPAPQRTLRLDSGATLSIDRTAGRVLRSRADSNREHVVFPETSE